ncbi:TolC family protein [Prosthecobacter vanneervenii]|uniref:Cobalt-zinc-cadmium efflux system outer membrane protein n=1 Tax=Prosthecobacter vanneervenii TaxID=48466 RepID=A0A7W7Y7T9_9BACT|nr:TolC family protein [Prosthecobacter vanneervenii]MBB5031169.1 cobalt-zinc-cadmium efflux system outer membrane protein [Prosthecobacter vanneervenii]
MKASFLLFLALGSFAGSASALSLSLADVAPRVRTHHPALKAARLAIAEAQGRQLGSGRLSNPSFNYDFQNQSHVSPQTGVFSFDQAFPVTRRLTLEKKLTSQLVQAATLEVRDVERKLIAEAQQQVVRLLTLTRQKALRQQQTELAQKLADFAEGRAKAGEVSPLDAKQVRLDSQRLRVEFRLLEAQSVSLLGQLKPMLGLRAEDTLSISGDLPPMELPTVTTWTLRPDYQLAQTKIMAAETDQSLARANRLQDVKMGLFASNEMQDVPGTGRVRTGYIGFRFSLPLPFWNRNQGMIAEKTATADRARLERDALAMQINGESGTARKEMETNASIVRETRENLLPLAAEQMDAMQKAYEAGQADLQSVLRSRDQRLQLESSTLDALRDFHLARIRYEAAVGKHAPAAPVTPQP